MVNVLRSGESGAFFFCFVRGSLFESVSPITLLDVMGLTDR
jgi:hypothetical protein